jgi:hypothetical protein
MTSSNGRVTIVKQPDGSSRSILSDGVTLDWSANGDFVVGWPDPKRAEGSPVAKPMGQRR